MVIWALVLLVASLVQCLASRMVSVYSKNDHSTKSEIIPEPRVISPKYIPMWPKNRSKTKI